MDATTRARIARHAQRASWQRLVARSPALAAAHADAGALADWLGVCWPAAKPAAAALLRAMRAQPWRVAESSAGDAAASPLSFVVQTGNGAWRVQLHVGSELAARGVAREPALAGGAES